MTNKLSPEVQVCYNEVQKSPENQRQFIFERACQKIKDKTQIALLVAMLWLSQAPNTVQAWEPQKIEAVKANSVVNNPEYKKLLSTLNVEFSRLVEQWKKEVSPENQAKFESYMKSIEKKLREWSLALSTLRVFTRMVSENWSFYTNFYNYVAKFEPFAELITAQRMEHIAQNKETIAQNKRDIATLNALADAFKE